MSQLLKLLAIAAFALAVLLLLYNPWSAPRTVIAPPAALQASYHAQAATPQGATSGGGSYAAMAVPTAPPSAPIGAPISTPIGTPAPTQLSSDLARSIDAYMQDIVAAGWFQGAVLVARNGEVVLSNGYGMANAAQNLPNTPQTRFRLASLTKQFTAMAIMILQSRGQLSVQDSICSYLDGCPDAWRPITLQHLLTHTSGLPNYTDMDGYGASQMLATTSDDLVKRFRDQPLLSDPGTHYMYENSDYVLLGKVIEKVSGQSYADFLQSAIFTPLGMRDSGVDQGTGGGAVGYVQPGTPAPALDVSTLFAAGSLYSTVEDMYRWDQALYTDQLLPQQQREQLWTPYLSNYGYGWQIGELNGHRKISHPGLIDGFATAIDRFPNDRVTVIVLGNLSSSDAGGIADYIATLALDS